MEKTDRNGRVTRFDYDGLGRARKERWYDSADTLLNTIATAYDLLDHTQSVGDGNALSAYEYASQ